MIGHKLAFLVTVIFLKLISDYKLNCEIRSDQNYRDLFKALPTTFKNNAKVCGFQDGNATVGREQEGNLNESKQNVSKNRIFKQNHRELKVTILKKNVFFTRNFLSHHRAPENRRISLF
jgi:hypothetical protein